MRAALSCRLDEERSRRSWRPLLMFVSLSAGEFNSARGPAASFYSYRICRQALRFVTVEDDPEPPFAGRFSF
jgi:hypothetical protein